MADGRVGWLSAISAITVLTSSQLLYEFGDYQTYADALHAAALATISGEPLGQPDAFAKGLEVLLAVFSVVVFATLAGTLGAYFLETRRPPSLRGDAGVNAFVPQLAITGAFLLVVASVGMFLAYIHHITQAIRVTTIISSVGTETREVIGNPRVGVPESPTGATLTLPPANDTVHSAGHGVVTMIDVPRLIRLAHGHDVVFELLTRMGDFVAEGMPIVDIHGNAEQLDHDAVRAALLLATDRSMHDDVAFGFRQLVDIAERALSAAVNDPTTAVQVLDEIHDLLRRLAVLPDPPVVRVDHDDVVRLWLRERKFAEFLDLGIDEIAHYGAEDLQVHARIREMLVDLKSAGRLQHQAAITAKQRQVATKQ